MLATQITTAPEGESSVNPVIITENAMDVIRFIVEVFGGKTDEGALAYDHDGTIFHSETRVDKTKFIVAERRRSGRLRQPLSRCLSSMLRRRSSE